jgi:hypothetical protein
VKNPGRDRAAGFATVSARPQPALSTAQPSRPYQQLAARPQQCAMSTRAFALFDSSSKSQNWFPVVRISLCLTLICLLNLHVARPHPPKKPRPRPGYLSCFLPFTSDRQWLSLEKDKWTAVFLVGACFDRGSEVGIQCAHPIQVQRGWPPSITEEDRAVGRAARF